MTDEEKKSFEKINRQIVIGECEKAIGIPVYISDLKILINLIEKQQKEIELKDKILTDLECFLKEISKNMKDEDFISSSIEYQNVLVKLYELKEKYQEEGE